MLELYQKRVSAESCASICPQGRMSSKGSRYVLANTEQLHDKIDSLIIRVRQLEGALEELQARHYPDKPHPLLSKEPLAAARPLNPVDDEEKHIYPNVAKEGLSEGTATLTLDDNGTQYSGSTGVIAYFGMVAQGPSDPRKRQKSETFLKALSDLPSDLSHFAYYFPFPLINPDTASMSEISDLGMRILGNCLPSNLEAWSLFENYWAHCSWNFTPFPRAEFVNHVLNPVYRRSFDDTRPLGHRLALLFMRHEVFAIGDLMDSTKPFNSASALRFYLLARASLCLNPVIESPTLMALQVLYLMNVFGLMSRSLMEYETMWVITGINEKLAISLGLHHDPTKLDLSVEEIENRQFTLAAIITDHTMQSLALGRPLSQSLGYVDWVYDPNDRNDPEKSSRYWVASFTRDCIVPVVETVVSRKSISYGRILELDRVIKNFPPYNPIAEPVEVEPLPLFIGTIREVTVLFLHRRCLAFALRDHPEDPLLSVFATSVIACFRTAATLITKMAEIMAGSPEMIERMWFTRPNVLVSTLILGSIVARSPGCLLASPAYLELEKASRLWESVADVCGPVLLRKLRSLKTKASKAFAQYYATQHGLHSRRPGGTKVIEEIHALGGVEKGGVLIAALRHNSSSPLRVEDKTPFRHSNTLSPGSTIPSATHPQGSIPEETVNQQYPTNHQDSLDLSSYPYLSMPQCFQDTNFIVEQAGGAIPNDFNDIFGLSSY
ncbi:hypothetical protein BU17DRAFT_98789 [Hysterangium stoloniferum]|nr:hypothetical protein BU17DRAFT_98789 [Hysterangium stoloniferum]